MNYFKKKEHECKCGCGLYNMSDNHMKMLNIARDYAEIPFNINSGSRCRKYNVNVRGMHNSEHLIGKASDIQAANSYQRFRVLEALIFAGFKRIGISEDFIHAGSSIIHPKEVLWLYNV